jgi:hypothetical protein
VAKEIAAKEAAKERKEDAPGTAGRGTGRVAVATTIKEYSAQQKKNKAQTQQGKANAHDYVSHSKGKKHPMQVHYALNMHSLCTLTMHSICTHYTLTIHSLYSLFTHYSLTIHSLCRSSATARVSCTTSRHTG